MRRLEQLINQLAKREKLPSKYRDHALENHQGGEREFHFKPDLLVIYTYFDDILVISLGEIGSHSELFS